DARTVTRNNRKSFVLKLMTSLQQATLRTRRVEHQEAYFDRATHLQDAIVSKSTPPHCAHEHPTPHNLERPPEAKDFSRRSFAFPSIARLGIRGTPSSRVPRAIQLQELFRASHGEKKSCSVRSKHIPR